MSIKTLISKLYFNEAPVTEKDMQKSRQYFIFEGSAARIIFALTSGAFFAGYAEYLGANESLNGIISSLPVLASVVQIFSPMVFEKMARRKFIISILCFIHRLLLSMMVLIPVISKDQTVRLLLLSCFYFISYSLAGFITPAASNWIIDLTPQHIRGRYFSMKEVYVLTAVTIITLVMGKVMDSFRDSGNEFGGFIVLFTICLIMTAVNFYFLSSIKEVPVVKSEVSLDIASIIRIPLQDRLFRKYLVIIFIWNLGLQVGGPYFAVYMVTGLKLGYTFIMVLGLIGTLSNVLLVRLWGNLADKKSWTYTTKMSIGLLSITHCLWFLVSPQTAYFLTPLLHITGGAAWAGIGISLFNIQFTLSPEKGRTIYLGFSAAMGGIIGFGSTLVGSTLLGILEKLKFKIIGLPVGNMQILFAASGILLAGCAGYIHLFLKEKKEDKFRI